MKKLFLYAAVAALAMTAASCQKESMDEIGPKDGLIFTASIDGGMDTKTTLTSERKVNWEATDEITVNGVVYTATPKSDATKADFKKKDSKAVDPTGTFSAFYPSNIQTGITAGGTLPAEQTYTAGKITNVPMFATSTTTSLSFKNICAVLAVTVKNADFPSVKSIKVSSSNCALSGAFTVSDGQTAVLTNATTVANTVILNCGTTAVTTASEGTVFYIAIPAQTYKNLKIELSDDGSNYTKAMTTKKDVDIAVAVNTVYPITFKADVATTGTAKATIGGKEVDVAWVQLWKDGPKFAKCNYGAESQSETSVGTAVDYSTACTSLWGSNWKTPSEDEMDLLNEDNVSYEYCLESGVYGFKFTGVQDGYTANYIFLPADGGNSDKGGASYWSSSSYDLDDSQAWYLSLYYDTPLYNCAWLTRNQTFNCYVRPVISN